MSITAIINTHNEERNIIRCLRSISPHVDEIVIVDAESTDKTRQLAKQYTKKIWEYPYKGYVEPARNFAIKKASEEWIILLDADEVMNEELGLKLRQLTGQDVYTYYRIPRKNLIFGKWITHSGWWPDYQIRLFKKDSVTWNDEIHSIPITEGKGTDLPVNEQNALIHHHYTSIDQYIERLNRYTSQEARQLVEYGASFEWKNLIEKPTGEFLTSFIMWEGYRSEIHGLALSLLQAFSFLIVQLKVWEYHQFKETETKEFMDESVNLIKKAHADILYWQKTKKNEQAGVMVKTIHQIKSRMKL